VGCGQFVTCSDEWGSDHMADLLASPTLLLLHRSLLGQLSFVIN
jgi:hypothetical protein